MKSKSSFLRIFSFMGKLIVFYIIGLLILGLLHSGFQVAISYLFMKMFNQFEIGNFKILKEILPYIFIILGIFIVLPFFTYLIRWINTITSGNIRKAIAKKLTNLPASYFKKNHSGNIISRCTNDVSEAERGYRIHLYHYSINIIVGIVTLVVLYFLDWRIASLSIGSALIILVINLIFARKLRHVSKEVQDKLARLNERFSNILAGIHIIKIFNIYNTVLNKYDFKNEDVYATSRKRVSYQAILTTINEMIFLVTFLGIAILGSYLVLIGDIKLGVIIAAVQLQNGISNLVTGLGGFITQMQSSLAAADRVFEFLDEEQEPNVFQLSEENEGKNPNTIAFQEVLFSYEDEIVLNKLSFNLPKNKVYALVGPSGGGKSTIFKLILNFYPPESGNIYINGDSISNQEIKDIRKLIAYVPQDAYLFTGSVLENIRYGKMDATMEEVIEAAKIANADEFIQQLDNGYDTQVGESGAQLSGGQRQRIAIARAVLKNAPILLLDEATSALDSESEQLIQDALNKLMVNRTTLIIAHRLSTIQDADKILVVSNGEIIEEGTHQQLLNQEGIYAKFYKQQYAS